MHSDEEVGRYGQQQRQIGVPGSLEDPLLVSVQRLHRLPAVVPNVEDVNFGVRGP